MTISLEQRVATLEASMGMVLQASHTVFRRIGQADIVKMMVGDERAEQVGRMQARITELEEAYRAEREHSGRLEGLLRDLRTFVDEEFGPFPVQSTEEAIAALAHGVFERRRQAGEDIAFLAPRAAAARRYGFIEPNGRTMDPSSNALVRFAYHGKAPSQNEYPVDHANLEECHRIFQALPAHRRTQLVEAQLATFVQRLGGK